MPATHTFQPYTYECPLEFYWKVYNKRFPKHQLFPFILDSEITEHIVEPNGNEKSIRRTKLDVDAPGWFKTLFDIHFSYFIEESYYDKQARKITIKTTNETLSSKAKMIDMTVYEVSPQNPNWCQFTQTGTVELLVSVLGFQKKIEKWVLDLYTSRYDESRKLDLKMIEMYKDEILLEQEREAAAQEQLQQEQQQQQTVNITNENNVAENPNTVQTEQPKDSSSDEVRQEIQAII